MPSADHDNAGTWENVPFLGTLAYNRWAGAAFGCLCGVLTFWFPAEPMLASFFLILFVSIDQMSHGFGPYRERVVRVMFSGGFVSLIASAVTLTLLILLSGEVHASFFEGLVAV